MKNIWFQKRACNEILKKPVQKQRRLGKSCWGSVTLRLPGPGSATRAAAIAQLFQKVTGKVKKPSSQSVTPFGNSLPQTIAESKLR